MHRVFMMGAVLSGLAAFALPAGVQAQTCRVCIGAEVGGGGGGAAVRSATGLNSPAGGGSAIERAALEATLVGFGFDTVVTDDPASDTCQVAVSYPGCGSCFNTPDISWVQAGHGYVQISDWGRDFQANDWDELADGTPVPITAVDASHPITLGVPSGWSALGFWRYDFDSDYNGWVTDADPDLASAFGHPRSLSARDEGAGRLVYVGWNVYGGDATAPDLTILRQSVEWAGVCSGGGGVSPLEVPTLSRAALAGLIFLMGAAALYILRR